MTEMLIKVLQFSFQQYQETMEKMHTNTTIITEVAMGIITVTKFHTMDIIQRSTWTDWSQMEIFQVINQIVDMGVSFLHFFDESSSIFITVPHFFVAF